MWGAGFLGWIMAVSPPALFAQGDGPRTHGKEMLTNTNIVNLTYLHGSGNVNRDAHQPSEERGTI